VMYRDIVDWATSKMSAHTSSMMFCRIYPNTTDFRCFRLPGVLR
jgi:hypothetical protein